MVVAFQAIKSNMLCGRVLPRVISISSKSEAGLVLMLKIPSTGVVTCHHSMRPARLPGSRVSNPEKGSPASRKEFRLLATIWDVYLVRFTEPPATATVCKVGTRFMTAALAKVSFSDWLWMDRVKSVLGCATMSRNTTRSVLDNVMFRGGLFSRDDEA